MDPCCFRIAATAAVALVPIGEKKSQEKVRFEIWQEELIPSLLAIRQVSM